MKGAQRQATTNTNVILEKSACLGVAAAAEMRINTPLEKPLCCLLCYIIFSVRDDQTEAMNVYCVEGGHGGIKKKREIEFGGGGWAGIMSDIL